MEIACDNIDRALNIEMRRKGMPRGNKWMLYQIAREVSAESLVLAAARLLDRPPARVAILTGAAVPGHMPLGENDGPFGAVVLAGALTRIGHQVSIFTDPAALPPIQALLERRRIAATATPVALKDLAEQQRIVDTHDLFVAIERLGGNRNGILYGVTGVSRSPHRANLDHVFLGAQKLGKPTLAVGDGGNELGFGKVYDQLMTRMPEFAAADRTPCDGGVYSVVPADVLVIGGSSNLGAYGVVGALALLRGDASLCHTPEEEFALHHVGVGLGLVDGGGGERIPWCDGIPADANAAVVRLVQNIVERTLDPPRERKF
jgi:D-glutamate cyclase